MKKFTILTTFFALFTLSLATLFHGETGADPVSGGLNPRFALTWDWFGAPDRLERLDIFKKVLGLIQENYVEPERVVPGEMFRKILDRVSQEVTEVRALYPEPDRAVLMVNTRRMEFDTNLRNPYALSAATSDALKFVRDNKKSDIADRDLETAAVDGALSTLDPHSSYLTPEMFAEMKVGTRGQFGGLGIEIGIRDLKLTILRPLPGTPASRAGLKSGDRITKIGGEPTASMSLQDAVDRMRGPKGTAVTLSVARKDWKTERNFTLTRDKINVASVTSQLLSGGVGYVRIKAFQENTLRDLNRQIKDLHAEAGGSLAGLILDLRNDPGGLLDQAISTADKFLRDGLIVKTVGAGNREREVQMAAGPGTEPDYPMAVLIDRGSASASEIVAGALKDRGRALILGLRSFGKGSVQSLYELPEDSALKLTVAQYLTPGDHSIQSLGIEPDIRLEPEIVSKDFVDLFRKQYFEGEAGLEHHLVNPKARKSAEPPVEIRYLDRMDEGDDVQMARLAGTLTNEQLIQDFPVRMAHDLLAGRPKASRPELAAAARKVAPEMQKREDEKLVLALREKGTDWTEGPTKAESRCGTPEAAWKIAPSADGSIRAGDKVKLSVTLRNPGPCTLYRARASTDSKNFLLNNQEFLFGRVAPRGEATREAKIEIPKSMPTALAMFQLSFAETHGVVPSPQQAQVAIRAIPKPQFAFYPEFRDRSGPHSRGNDDGLIQRGENVELVVHIRNTGPVATEQAAAALRTPNEKRVDVKFSRHYLGVLKPGEERSVSFELHVPSGFPESSFAVELVLFDRAYRSSLTRKFRLSLAAPGAYTKDPRSVYARSDGAPVYSGPATSFPAVAFAARSARLSALGRAGEFVRVSLPPGVSGWVLLSDLAGRPESPGSAADSGITWSWNRAPQIRLDPAKLAFAPSPERFLRVNGNVANELPVRDLYITVNGKKVFYEPVAGAEPGAKAGFDVTIPLEVGLNRIAVVARDENDLFSQEDFVIQRLSERPPGGDALAKASDTTFTEQDYLLDPENP